MNFKNIFLEAKTLSILELFIRSSILYFLLFGTSKIMGFCQIRQLTPYNFLMASSISNISAIRMVNPKVRLIDAIGTILLYTLINLLIAYLYMKAPSIVSQNPIILIKEGKLIKENLSRVKLTIDNIFSILRENSAENIQDVDYLIAESTGEFSISINNNNLPITRKDMDIDTSDEILSQIIIYKGMVDETVLNKNGLTYKWIEEQLKLNHIYEIANVYIGVLTPKKDLYIIR